MLDPGIGFGKTVAHNLELLRRLRRADGARAPDRGRHLAQELSRAHPRRRGGRDRAAGRAQRLPGTIATNVLALERGASVFRVHDVAPVRDALAVAAATLGGRWATASEATSDRDAGRARLDEAARAEEDGDEDAIPRRGDGRVGHDRDHRPVAVHPSRRQRGRARGRPAAGARPAPGPRRDGRHRDRLDRGHGRLRGGLPAGRADRPAALAQDARAAVQHDRRPAARATTSSRAYGSRRPSPSRRSRWPWTRSRSRSGARRRSSGAAPRLDWPARAVGLYPRSGCANLKRRICLSL